MYSEQLRVLLLRSARAKRLVTLGKDRFIQYVAVGIVVGIFYWQRGKDKSLLGAFDTASLVFFEVVCTAGRSVAQQEVQARCMLTPSIHDNLGVDKHIYK